MHELKGMPPQTTKNVACVMMRQEFCLVTKLSSCVCLHPTYPSWDWKRVNENWQWMTNFSTVLLFSWLLIAQQKAGYFEELCTSSTSAVVMWPWLAQHNLNEWAKEIVASSSSFGQAPAKTPTKKQLCRTLQEEVLIPTKNTLITSMESRATICVVVTLGVVGLC